MTRKVMIALMMSFIAIQAFATEAVKEYRMGVVLDKNMFDQHFIEELKEESNSLIGIDYKLLFETKHIHQTISFQESLKKYGELNAQNLDYILVVSDQCQANRYLEISKKRAVIASCVSSKEQSKDESEVIFLNTVDLKRDVALIKKALNYENLVIVSDTGSLSDASIKTPSMYLGQKQKQPVYFPENVDLNAKAIGELIEYLNQNKIPFVTAKLHKDSVAYFKRAKNSQGKMVRRLSFILNKMIQGKKVLPKYKQLIFKKELILNIENTKKHGVHLNWDTLVSYESVNSEKNLDKISLYEAIRESLSKNLDIIVELESKKITDKEVRKAWNKYLPSLEASLTGAMIDEDRAKGSFGLFKQKSLSGKLVLKQLLFAEKARLNIDVKEKTSVLTDLKINQIKQDIALETAEIYINILRAKTYEKIQVQNLELSKKHLNIAETRNKIGEGKVSDIYRWKTQIALNKKSLLKAKSNVKIAKMALLRLLHRDMKEDICVSDDLVEGSHFLTEYKKIEEKLKNKQNRKHLLKEFVKYTLNHSIELKQLDGVKGIHQRYLKSVKRSFFMPTVGLQAEMGYRFWDKTPEMEISLPPGYEAFAPMIKGMIPTVDDFEWSIGVNVSLPLFDQYERFSDLDITKLKLSKLNLQKQSAMNKLEQRTLTMIDRATASFASIKLAKEASQSAKGGLKLVQDLYLRGAVSISELIDVQNNELLAKELVINSKYEFIIDIMNVKRALGMDLDKNNEKIMMGIINK